MARWATTIVIAGVTFTGCRGELIDAEKFLSNYVGSVKWANSGDAISQVVNVGKKGNTFGIRMISAEISKLQTMFTNIEAATAALGTFAVNIVDAEYNINVNCIKDFNQKFYTRGKAGEGWAEDVVLRFISRSAV